MPIPFLTLNKSVGDIDSLVIPVDCSDVKTKLAYSWTVWVQTDSEVSEDVADYDSMTKSIAEFDSLETFWRTFSGIPQPSAFLTGEKLSLKSDSGLLKIDSLMLFKDGVKPQWEDPVNASGGHFQFHWKPTGITPAQLDEYWNNIVLALAGNTIESEGEFAMSPILQGVRFVDKIHAHGRQAGVRIEVWFSVASDPRHLQKVRSRLEKAMALKLDGTPGQIPRCDIRHHTKRL